MSRKLYIGNLPYETTSEELAQLFSSYGTVVSAEIQHNRRTGRSRGFGFVQMSSPEEMQAAITGMHENEFQGRKLQVNESRPRPSRSSSFDDRGGFGGFGGFGGGRY